VDPAGDSRLVLRRRSIVVAAAGEN